MRVRRSPVAGPMTAGNDQIGEAPLGDELLDEMQATYSDLSLCVVRISDRIVLTVGKLCR